MLIDDSRLVFVCCEYVISYMYVDEEVWRNDRIDTIY